MNRKQDESRQNKNVLFRVTEADYNALKAKAEADGRTISSYVRWLVVQRLSDSQVGQVGQG